MIHHQNIISNTILILAFTSKKVVFSFSSTIKRHNIFLNYYIIIVSHFTRLVAITCLLIHLYYTVLPLVSSLRCSTVQLGRTVHIRLTIIISACFTVCFLFSSGFLHEQCVPHYCFLDYET